jgi:hypothetical protein
MGLAWYPDITDKGGKKMSIDRCSVARGNRGYFAFLNGQIRGKQMLLARGTGDLYWLASNLVECEENVPSGLALRPIECKNIQIR